MEVIVMTSCKRGQDGRENVIRMDRVPEDQVDESRFHHVAKGPLKGIVINKGEANGVKDEDTAPHIRLDFTACLWKNNKPQNGPEKRERREIRFWFKPGVERGVQVNHGKAYFRHLIKPETFPRDYVHFIKKAVLLARHFASMRRIDLVLKPLFPPSDDDSEEEPDDTVQRANLRRLRTKVEARRRLKEAIGDDSPDEEYEYGDFSEIKEKLLDNFITVLTPAKYDYQYLPEVNVSKKRSIVFRVRAKADAHIALSSVYGDTDHKTYEIVIGASNNAKSLIRDGGQGEILDQAATLNLLDRYEFRTFWISWDLMRLRVGEGDAKGMNSFLSWNIPRNKKYSINCLAVSTGVDSDGKWEFIEKIMPQMPERGHDAKMQRRARVCTALLWAAKKQKMLQVLEAAYPNTLHTADLLRLSNIRMRDMMASVVVLRGLQKNSLISEVSKGVWARVPTARLDKGHEVKVMKELPRFTGRESPNIAVITALFCEKLAVDTMMVNKTSYVKYKPDGTGEVYTLGYIGHRFVVTTKLPRTGTGEEITISNQNAITRLLGMFPLVRHIFIVGVAGAVPHYTDYKKHVRLGDIVIALPETNVGSVYVHCDKVKKTGVDEYEFVNRTWRSRDETLQNFILHLRGLQESQAFVLRPWMKYLDKAKKILEAEDDNYDRPPARTDKLYAMLDGELVHVAHPKPAKGEENPYSETQPNIRYGIFGSGKFVARDDLLRRKLAESTGVIAYDAGFHAVFDALEGSRNFSYAVVRGISDYVDGTVNKEWQPYASLCAAAYMRTLIAGLPSTKTTY